MNKSILVAFFAPVILLGCATTSDVTNIQVQIKAVKADVRNLFKETTTAKYAAERANIRADKAYVASRLALHANEELNINITNHLK